MTRKTVCHEIRHHTVVSSQLHDLKPSTLWKVFGSHWSGGWVGPTAELENLETTRQIIYT